MPFSFFFFSFVSPRSSHRHAIPRFIDQRRFQRLRRAMQFRSYVIRNARVTTDGAIARKSRTEVGIFTIEETSRRGPGTIYEENIERHTSRVFEPRLKTLSGRNIPHSAPPTQARLALVIRGEERRG